MDEMNREIGRILRLRKFAKYKEESQSVAELNQARDVLQNVEAICDAPNLDRNEGTACLLCEDGIRLCLMVRPICHAVHKRLPD